MSLLLSHGWKRVKEDSERIYLLRPGETTSETSGNFHKGKNCLYLFTTSDAKLDQGKPYSPSQLYNALECGGDWSKTALELGKKGYGDYKPSTPEKETSVEPVGDIIQERKKSLLIDLTEKVPAPQIAISIKNPSNNEDIILGTLGDFSLVIGKAKSRKSFFCSIIAAVALGVNIVLGRLKSHLPEDKRNVLYFDTEQSKYYVQKAMQRICKLANMENPGNLFGYGLRTLDPRERLEIIETLISETQNLGLVVIDGIKDLITSINDEEQSTMIASKLLKWSEVYNIHIVCVLHQNKGDDKARGHIGTELQNKAQTVLSVTKDSEDKNYSIVSAEFCRDKEPEDFVFEIDQEGIPIASKDYVKKEVGARSKKQPLTNPTKYNILFEAFKYNDGGMGYSDLWKSIKSAYQRVYNENFADNKAKEIVTEGKIIGWLMLDEKTKKHTLKEYGEGNLELLK
jgi:hypothetical protein